MEAAGMQQVAVAANGYVFNTYVKPATNNEGYIVCHHGVGSSAATFALFLKNLGELHPNLGFVAYDCRHHGLTVANGTTESDEGEILDLDTDTLCADMHSVLAYVFQKVNAAPRVPLALVGHSMGGTVVSKFAHEYEQQYHLRGLVVVDAVEGYAMSSFGSMHVLLGMWPERFQSIDRAVKWFVYDGAQLRNKASARISVPPLLKEDKKTGEYVWRLNLKHTSGNWDSWFKNLDELFVSAKCARLLILSGVSKLDTDLTRAQMQGKFQMSVISDAGHYIQEDSPLKVAHVISDFWDRQSAAARIVPKFGKFRDS